MTEHPAAKPKPSLTKWGLWGAAVFGVAAVVYIIAQASSNPDGGGNMKSLARGEMAKLTFPAEASVGPATSFYDAEGKPTRLADHRGKVLVVNFWATWCPPCVAEMPTLATLAREFEGKPVEVMAISIDRESDLEKAKAFIGQHAPLQFYNDPKSKLPFQLSPPATGMPTTVIYGADGVEIARLAGEADWSTPEARAVVESALARSGG